MIFPLLSDIFLVTDEVYNLIIADTAISCKKKILLTRKYPCINNRCAAVFLSEVILFSLERKNIKVTKDNCDNDISEAYNQLIFAIDNFKKQAEQFMKGSENYV